MTDAQPTEKRKRRRGAKARLVAQESRQNDVSVKKKIEADISTSASKPQAQTPSGNQNTNATKDKNQKKKRAPKKGEPGFLTPTQMRNARKRRAKQKKRENVNADGSTCNEEKPKKKKKKQSQGKSEDPSSRYINDPRSAPLVKKAKNFFGGLDIGFQVYIGELTGWRTVSKLPVRSAQDNAKSCIIGLFKPGSHTIVNVPNCSAHHPSINKAIAFLQIECETMEVAHFNESDGKGNLRYVCLNVERRTGEIQLTLVWNSAPYKNEECEGKDLLDKFTKHLISKAASLKLHSLWVHFNGLWKHADNIFDYGSSSDDTNLWKHLYGPKHIIETLDLAQCRTPDVVKLHFPPNVFRQANLDAFTKIVAAVRKYVLTYNDKRSEKELPSCIELYGGVGTIGLHLCDLFSSFVSSDENPYNKLCFENAVKSLSAANRKKCTYIPKNATDVIKDTDILPKSEIIVVDPPRKGLDDFVTQSLINAAGNDSGPELLVYISCGFDAFIRDCNQLTASGCWKLEGAEGHLLFPGSDAIETLAFFRRIHSEVTLF